jgi:hypothetical protein
LEPRFSREGEPLRKGLLWKNNHSKYSNRARDFKDDRRGNTLETKLRLQAEYIVWRDGVVVPSQKDPRLRGKRSGDFSSEIPALPPADPGDVTAHRWRALHSQGGGPQSD